MYDCSVIGIYACQKRHSDGPFIDGHDHHVVAGIELGTSGRAVIVPSY